MSKKHKGSEVRLDLGEAGSSGDAWSEMLKELEEASPSAPAPKRKKAPKPPPSSPPTPEGAMMEAAGKVQKALDGLEVFMKEHPYLVAPNVYKLWREYLKETLVTLEQQHGHLVRAKEGR